MNDKISEYISSKKFNENIGIQLERGWSPVLAAEYNDTQTELYLKVVDWVGGEGDEPATPVSPNNYITETGYGSVTDAVNFLVVQSGGGLFITYTGSGDPNGVITGTTTGEVYLNEDTGGLWIWNGSLWRGEYALNYTLPTASTTVLGGVKVDGTTVTIDAGGVISAASGTSGITGANNKETNYAKVYDNTVAGSVLNFRTLYSDTPTFIGVTQETNSIKLTGNIPNGYISYVMLATNLVGTGSNQIAAGNHTHSEFAGITVRDTLEYTVNSPADTVNPISYSTIYLTPGVAPVPKIVTLLAGTDNARLSLIITAGTIEVKNTDTTSMYTFASSAYVELVYDATQGKWLEVLAIREATTSVRGTVRFATPAQVQTGGISNLAVTPQGLIDANPSERGLIRTASNTISRDGTNDTAALVPANFDINTHAFVGGLDSDLKGDDLTTMVAAPVGSYTYTRAGNIAWVNFQVVFTYPAHGGSYSSILIRFPEIGSIDTLAYSSGSCLVNNTTDVVISQGTIYEYSSDTEFFKVFNSINFIPTKSYTLRGHIMASLTT